MLLRGTVALHLVHGYHTDLTLLRAENDMSNEVWQAEWYQNCVQYVRFINDRVNLATLELERPTQADIARITSTYLDSFPPDG